MASSSPQWSDSQKSALVRQLIAGGLSLQQACSQYGLSTEQLKDWVRIFRRSVRQALDHPLRSSLSVRGLEVGALSSAEVSGNLADMAVADVLQTIQISKKSARVTVARDGEESRVWCEGGEIVDAESGVLNGEEALYRVLSFEHGTLGVDFAPSQRGRRINLSTPRLLLEAAKRSDERARLLRRIGSRGQVFSVNAAAAAQRARDLGSEELEVLSLFDGVRSFEEVIATSGLPDNQTLNIGVRFYEAGLLTPNALGRSTTLVKVPSGGDRPPPSSFRPFVGVSQPESRRPPLWLLAAGAALFSVLGAVTAIAYADALERYIDRGPASAQVVSSRNPDPKATPAAAPLCPNDMVLIRGGAFFMGSDSSHPALHWARPAHKVNVASFCMDTHEVSVEQYSRCVDGGQCEPAHTKSSFYSDGPDGADSKDSEELHSEQCNADKPGRQRHPINCVSFYQAARECAFRGARLPTEAEWEFAARGDTNRLFPWGNAQPTADHMNACGKECDRWHRVVGLMGEMHGLMFEEDDGYSGTAPVGSFPLGATSDGVLDLIGNVFEWTAGGLYPYERQPLDNPKGPIDAESYVIRGGNFNSGIPEFSDPALRFAMLAESYSHGVGFRCAGTPDYEPATTQPAPAPGSTGLERPGG
jgi:formylglycine-generating enzyme required for sulfatase activity/transposase-like protein